MDNEQDKNTEPRRKSFAVNPKATSEMMYEKTKDWRYLPELDEFVDEKYVSVVDRLEEVSRELEWAENDLKEADRKINSLNLDLYNAQENYKFKVKLLEQLQESLDREKRWSDTILNSLKYIIEARADAEVKISSIARFLMEWTSALPKE